MTPTSKTITVIGVILLIIALSLLAHDILTRKPPPKIYCFTSKFVDFKPRPRYYGIYMIFENGKIHYVYVNVEDVTIGTTYEVWKREYSSWVKYYIVEVLDIGMNTECKRWHKYDFNHDGKVNMRDIALVARAYGSDKGDPLYNPRFDLDNDHDVDLADLAIIGRYFGSEK